MVEGIVFEVKRDYVIVMTNSGEFKKLKKKGKVIDGDIYRGNVYINSMRYYAAAALIAFILTGFTGYNAYAHQVVGYVDIMGDKNVRLYVNRMGNVQKSEGLTNQKSIKNLSIYDAVKHIASLPEGEAINLQQVKYNEIKSSKFNALEVEKNVKKALKEKNAAGTKENKKNESSKHQENKGNAPGNINQLNDNANGGNSQLNNPPGHSMEKDNKENNNSSNGFKNTDNSSKPNNHSNSNSKNGMKNGHGIKNNGHGANFKNK